MIYFRSKKEKTEKSKPRNSQNTQGFHGCRFIFGCPLLYSRCFLDFVVMRIRSAVLMVSTHLDRLFFLHFFKLQVFEADIRLCSLVHVTTATWITYSDLGVFVMFRCSKVFKSVTCYESNLDHLFRSLCFRYVPL
jgi:hypothetical protein